MEVRPEGGGGVFRTFLRTFFEEEEEEREDGKREEGRGDIFREEDFERDITCGALAFESDDEVEEESESDSAASCDSRAFI